MCGIAGIHGAPTREGLLRMARAQAHRGPDGEGIHLSGRIGLAHRRLSIIDLSEAGANPMSNDEGDLVITFNGEVYNFQELRPELERLGHRFRSRTDTEVVLRAHEEWGDAAIERFNGMFAYGLWDETRKRLTLVRDRMGIKPLFYARLPDGGLAFASEVKALLALGVDREVDQRAVHEFLNLRYVVGERTMFRGIRALLPGHVLKADAKGIRVGRYWSYQARPEERSETAWEEAIRSTLRAAVQRHMISDVPVGIYLSGGIDSSAFVALASETADEPLKTFCMGFGEANDELADARLVADRFKTEHTEVIVKAQLLRDLPRMTWHMDAPRRNLYPYYLAEAASKHVKVVQNGLGGDELFGGYEFRYQFMEAHARRRRAIPAARRKALAAAAKRAIAAKAAAEPVDGYPLLRELRKDATIDDLPGAYLLINAVDEVFDDPMLAQIYGPRMKGRTQREIRAHFEPRFARRRDATEAVLKADIELRLAHDFLPVDDAMGMAFSLENRVPFLDAEMVDLARRIPASLKYRDGGGKHILKKALAPLLPRETLRKKKQGFSPNVASSYQDEVRFIAQRLLPGGELVRGRYVKSAFIEKVLRAPPDARMQPHQLLVWKMVAFEVWHKMYFGYGGDSPPLDAASYY